MAAYLTLQQQADAYRITYSLPPGTETEAVFAHAIVSKDGTVIVDGDALKAAGVTGFEPALGNPGTDGFVLSSTTGGVRSWIASGGGGGAVWGTITGSITDQTDLVPYLFLRTPFAADSDAGDATASCQDAATFAAAMAAQDSSSFAALIPINQKLKALIAALRSGNIPN